MKALRGQDDALDVHVSGGTVRGVAEGRTIAWRGIPYAASTGRTARFRAPLPPAPWPGVRDGSRYGDIAPQSHHGQFNGAGAQVPSSEDCLSVNVRVAARTWGASSAAQPVMVFIHGGGYSTGSSRDFSGQGEGFVLGGPVVYVSFNYRLGALGYLDFTRYGSQSRPIESNLGLRDQVALLRWVRENIAVFGGDPGNVTIFGESAGGNAVTTLMATPAAGGLFARAVAQSSPTNAIYTPDVTARWAAEFVDILRDQLAGRVRHNGRRKPVERGEPRHGEEPGAGLELLITASAAELVNAAVTLQIRTPDAYPGAFCLAPVIDGDLLPERPMTAFRRGRAHRVPLIIGTNEREGSIFRGRIDILPRSPARIQALFDAAPPESHEQMRRVYDRFASRRAVADFSGDFGFWYPTSRVADFHSRFAAVHAYRFDFAPRLLKITGLDATHGVEMFALFGRIDDPTARAFTAIGGREAYARAGERIASSG